LKTIDFGETQNQIVDNEIIELLQKGAISECKHEDNEYHHFKMENIETVLNSIKRNSYFVNLDLQNAYFFLSMHKYYRKYLKFEWRDKLYQFNCLCFGISSAPRVFSKLMKVIFAHIRRMGISAFYYIDDSLIEADSPYLCTNQSQTLMTMMENLGFYINYEKSNLIPSTRIEYLGHLIDSVIFKVYLPDEKVEKILISYAEM
jgi:hypothetical protein